jgi:Protein of unknown function (DUF2934)
MITIEPNLVGGRTRNSPKNAGSIQSLSEKIRRRAFEIWLRRRGEGGSDTTDWLEAAEEIFSEMES